MSKRKWIVSLLFLVICFTGMQFIRPEIKNPPVTGDIAAPAEVKNILKRSCYDCHSNETNLKWFDKIAPAYWLVAGHVKKGRQALNFSTWDSLAPADQKGNLYLSLNQILFKEMPRSDYSLLHPTAKITENDITTLKNYVTSLTPVKISDTSRFTAVEKQYNAWITRAASSPDVKPVLNGIGYINDYAAWKAISTTDRFDNNTLRVIFGNDIAVRAIEQQHTNPWPNGTVFAKVAWEQLIDADGQVHTGEFKQVEFMIKDAQKYKSTAGWGWARWKGLDLKPYGKTVLFATECVNCHKPLKDNDFVFTTPLSLKEDYLKWNVITTQVDKKNKTMSTLYGNDIAFRYARNPKGTTYPVHAELAMVTWNQKADEHWFGANIPSQIKSVELVKFEPDPVYQGNGDATVRTAAIVQQRMSVTP
ncbi:Cytochrome P460 [Chitinophaga sp. CF118]|uniref:cytochrome P460 family protein n=1 Tax=Chitinophaga sp. CF118 TaxID=1884367 RepID=UPI0008E36CFF|nr:cytochrome P460 family protein [Chitinophaga sp. CF118]SFD89674.1 Cytochrome P460 [Chitinophaga sp. CF118]